MDEEKKQEQLEPSFLAVVMMLGGSASNYLAEAQDVEKKNERKQNLELARYVIDLLAVLEQKTAGNLDENEQKAVEIILADLRMQYVRASG
ncbi:MAG: DUF1844 domain-containing protein [Candidatus Glassbacteria bacterium]|nr:DUF1844 domain-containing protein [Candidatus Glassbacteria bacterium]